MNRKPNSGIFEGDTDRAFYLRLIKDIVDSQDSKGYWGELTYRLVTTSHCVRLLHQLGYSKKLYGSERIEKALWWLKNEVEKGNVGDDFWDHSYVLLAFLHTKSANMLKKSYYLQHVRELDKQIRTRWRDQHRTRAWYGPAFIAAALRVLKVLDLPKDYYDIMELKGMLEEHINEVLQGAIENYDEFFGFKITPSTTWHYAQLIQELDKDEIGESVWTTIVENIRDSQNPEGYWEKDTTENDDQVYYTARGIMAMQKAYSHQSRFYRKGLSFLKLCPLFNIKGTVNIVESLYEKEGELTSGEWNEILRRVVPKWQILKSFGNRAWGKITRPVREFLMKLPSKWAFFLKVVSWLIMIIIVIFFVVHVICTVCGITMPELFKKVKKLIGKKQHSVSTIGSEVASQNRLIIKEVKNDIKVREIPAVELRGKEEKVKVYDVLGKKSKFSTPPAS